MGRRRTGAPDTAHVKPDRQRKEVQMDVQKLQVEELEERIAPRISTVLTNPGGNTPQGGGAGNGQAIDETAVNPAGHAPPGQN